MGKLEVTNFDISKLETFIENLGKSTPIIQKNVRDLTMNTAVSMKLGLVAGTPVDSGHMATGWRIRQHKSDANTVCSISIRNNAVQASAVDLGVAPGDAPWPSPTKGKKRAVGQKKVQEKTILSKGRIWSTQAIGGITPKVIQKSVVNKLCRDIANSIVKTLVR